MMHPTEQAYQFLAATVEVEVEDLIAGIRRYVAVFNANLMASGRIEIDQGLYGKVRVKVNDHVYRCDVRTLNSCGYEPTGCILEGYILEDGPLYNDYFDGSELYVQVEFDRLSMDRLADESFVDVETRVTQGVVVARNVVSIDTWMTTSREYALLNELFDQRKPR